VVDDSHGAATAGSTLAKTGSDRGVQANGPDGESGGQLFSRSGGLQVVCMEIVAFSLDTAVGHPYDLVADRLWPAKGRL
jgi:hypothetical protein